MVPLFSSRGQLAYNQGSLRRSSGIVFLLLTLALGFVPFICAHAQSEQVRASQMLLIIPFENQSNLPGLDWIGESFPEVMSNRLNAGSLFLISRDDRLSAFDHLGIPASAKPSRATVYQVAQSLDADYVLMGDYRYDGQNLTARCRLMDLARLRLGPELTESGPLTDLIKIQTALAWDVLDQLKRAGNEGKAQFMAKFAPVRLDALENYVRGVSAGNSQEKIKHFKEAVRIDPANTLAVLQLAKAYYEVRDYASAMNWFSRIPKDDPAINEAQFYLGLSAFYAEQMDKAEAAFSALSSRLPLTEVFNNLGVVAARRRDRRARAYFERSVQGDPNDADYHFNLAIELYREAEPQAAARELRAALAIRNDAEAKGFLDAVTSAPQPVPRIPMERIKRNYDESGFRQLALEIDNADELRLQKTTPVQHALFHVQRGQELLEQGVIIEAEKQFREAVKLDPANAAAHAGLAHVLEASQDNEEARREAQAALRIKPLPEAYLVLARLELAENNRAAAEKDLNQALALDPANPAAVGLKNDLAVKARTPQP